MLSTLNCIFTAVINAWNSRHGEEDGIYIKQILFVFNGACQTVYVVIIDEIIQIQSLIDSTVAKLDVYKRQGTY